MCVLHVSSESDSFREFLSKTKLPVYRWHEKGERSRIRKEIRYEDSGFSCKVSNGTWDGLHAQVEDAITLLRTYEEELKSLVTRH